ncbi:hypothetical protein GCM10010345_44700 [Streptomyces canarius]|uniref:Uncharacterized protein n=1 Tax=Streptomyces canarius TaxID=285453 RepID=A0ABQ3CQS7_9ACTN|nr:hypothetical protein GCM10010345_44700 [Streptomyces canarius]
MEKDNARDGRLANEWGWGHGSRSSPELAAEDLQNPPPSPRVPQDLRPAEYGDRTWNY